MIAEKNLLNIKCVFFIFFYIFCLKQFSFKDEFCDIFYQNRKIVFTESSLYFCQIFRHVYGANLAPLSRPRTRARE